MVDDTYGTWGIDAMDLFLKLVSGPYYDFGKSPNSYHYIHLHLWMATSAPCKIKMQMTSSPVAYNLIFFRHQRCPCVGTV